MQNIRQMETSLISDRLTLGFDHGTSDLEIEVPITTEAAAQGPPPPGGAQVRLTALFVTEIIGQTGVFSLEVVVDDDLVMKPSVGKGHEDARSLTLLAFVDGVKAGDHTVSVRFRPARPPGAAFGSRTLTVWETVVAGEPQVIG
ncbi:hypothetical protein R5H30_21440 [Sulfitobacter sp. D35]|uniref:hypothetical protein n=1 Tax=Sulfitobacter sp. D35 TaxID=3083252 RepID=UPI00296F2FEC|nr:hypothetical protein [Sulfitobacter sp. D35]MDW4500563.1 hypothetical protein [Sulfitobacter sp. D35]